MSVFKIKNVKIKELFFCLPFFLILLASYPYVFECIIPLPGVIVLTSLCLLYAIWQSSRLNIKRNIPSSIRLCFVIQIFVWLIYYIIHNDSSYITRIVFIITTSFTLLALYKKSIEGRFFYYNTLFITLQSLLSMVAFILCFVGILTPLFSFRNIDTRTAYFFGIASTNTLMGNIGRMAGFFDEPGALATWGVFALVFNKIFYKNRYIEYILIFCLFSTLSLAYIILLGIYLILYYHKNVIKLIPLLMICFIVCWFVIEQQGHDSLLYDMTFGRLDRTLGGEYGRKELEDLARSYFYQSPLIGHGAGNIEEVAYVSDNYLATFANDGIIGSIVLYLPLIIVVYKKKSNKDIFYGCLLLITCYTQRPFHINLLHYLMLYGYCLLALSNENYLIKEKK